jgi:hypothetical protein
MLIGAHNNVALKIRNCRDALLRVRPLCLKTGDGGSQMDTQKRVPTHHGFVFCYQHAAPHKGTLIYRLTS